MDLWIERVARALLYLAATALVMMTSLVVLASFMRYGFGKPLPFTEELVALLYLAMVFLAIPIVSVTRQHVNIDFLQMRERLRSPLQIVADLVMIAFTGWFSVLAYDFAMASMKIQSKSDQVGLILWPWMALMMALMAFAALIALFQAARAVYGLSKSKGVESKLPKKDAA